MAHVAQQADRQRRSRRPRRGAREAGIPYTMKLADGRTVFVEVPGRMADTDRGGQLAFTAEGVALLDRVRALASRITSPPSPAFLIVLREALGLTQEQLGEAIGRDKLTISRWERGSLRPSADSLARLNSLARKKKREGVVLPG